MLQKDHLMRLFTQFQNAVARVLALKHAGQFEEALGEISAMMEQLLTLDARQMGEIEEPELVERLKDNGTLDSDRALMIAVLLHEEGEIHYLERRAAEADDRNRKKLVLLLEAYLSESARIPADFFDKVENSLERLEGKRLSSFVMWRLFRFFEKTGRYGQAENALFELAARNDVSPVEISREGERFYNQLQDRSDEELRKGDLSKEEVEEGRRELRRLIDPTTNKR